MNINEDYETLLETSLKEELVWLEEEFHCLFKFKRNRFTKDDINNGTIILDNVIDNIKKNNSEELLNLLAITLNKIEHTYPEFF